MIARTPLIRTLGPIKAFGGGSPIRTRRVRRSVDASQRSRETSGKLRDLDAGQRRSDWCAAELECQQAFRVLPGCTDDLKFHPVDFVSEAGIGREIVYCGQNPDRGVGGGSCGQQKSVIVAVINGVDGNLALKTSYFRSGIVISKFGDHAGCSFKTGAAA